MPGLGLANDADDLLRSELAALEALIAREGEGYIARHHDLILGSAFQPIVSVAHRRPVAHEALLRARRRNGGPVSPLAVFAALRSTHEVIHIDRLSRFLHIQNYLRSAPQSTWLFLNVDVRSINARNDHSPFVGRLLRHFGIEGHRLVIEILEGAIARSTRLTEAVAYFRSRGCLTAIDDFGSGHSNFDRLWHLSPEFVKLDRSLIRQALDHRRVRNLLPHLVALLHEIGALVIMEGVETEDQALIAVDSNVDLIQGFAFGEPQPTPATHEPDGLPALHARIRRHLATPPAPCDRLDEVFVAVIRRLATGTPWAEARAALGGEPRLLRAYILDADGRQAGPPYIPRPRATDTDPRYVPLADTAGADWFSRPYFRRASAHPGEPQLTRPYFSIPDATLCVTWACSYDMAGTMRVLCCDLRPDAVGTAP